MFVSQDHESLNAQDLFELNHFTSPDQDNKKSIDKELNDNEDNSSVALSTETN